MYSINIEEFSDSVATTSLVTIHLPHLDEPLQMLAPATVNDHFVEKMVERAVWLAGKDVPTLLATPVKQGFISFEERIVVRIERNPLGLVGRPGSLAMSQRAFVEG